LHLAAGTADGVGRRSDGHANKSDVLVRLLPAGTGQPYKLGSAAAGHHNFATSANAS